MKIYLKGYYGYKNFGDECILFGIIGEIFKKYAPEQLVIEVGNKKRIEHWVQKNKPFIDQYYKDQNIKVNREKIQFFEMDERSFSKAPKSFQRIFPRKWISYAMLLLGRSPYKNFFKIFGGGEVIDETRAFPHQGWNLLFLYPKTIFSGNFALYGGFGSQKKKLTPFLTNILCKRAKSVVAREKSSYLYAKKVNNQVLLQPDLTKGILEFFMREFAGSSLNSKNSKQYRIINLSPVLNQQEFLTLLPDPKDDQWYFFPADLALDIPLFSLLPKKYQASVYDRTEKPLLEIFSFLYQSSAGIGSRLHFLYCYKVFQLPFRPLHQSSKLQHNL